MTFPDRRTSLAWSYCATLLGAMFLLGWQLNTKYVLKSDRPVGCLLISTMNISDEKEKGEYYNKVNSLNEVELPVFMAGFYQQLPRKYLISPRIILVPSNNEFMNPVVDIYFFTGYPAHSEEVVPNELFMFIERRLGTFWTW